MFRNVRPSSIQIIEYWPIRKHFDLDHFLGFILIIFLDLTRTGRLPSRLVLAMSKTVPVFRNGSVFRYNWSHSFDYLTLPDSTSSIHTSTNQICGIVACKNKKWGRHTPLSHQIWLHKANFDRNSVLLGGIGISALAWYRLGTLGYIYRKCR